MNFRIVMVEDNPSDVELVQTAFAEIGIEAAYTIFHDGDQAIAGMRKISISSELPHLVLLDLNLPRTSGHEVLIDLRSHAALAHTPVVVFSTSNHPTDRRLCLEAGADDYQVKPPHFDQLIAVVEQLRSRWLEQPV